MLANRGSRCHAQLAGVTCTDTTYDIAGSTPEEYAANIRSEMAKWENVVRTTNMERLN